MKIEKIVPTSIVTIYSNNHIEHRSVVDGKIKEAKSLYKSTAKSIFKFLNKSSPDFFFRGLIPDKVKCFNNNDNLEIVWTFKSAVRKLYFTEKGKKHNGLYAIPNLCFKLINTTIYVCAYNKFGLKERAYMPPFVNIYTSFSVCMGSVEVDLSSFKYVEDIIEYIEDQFFGSMFTHINQIGPYHKKGKNKKKYDPLWLDKYDKKNEKRTIKDFINEIS